MIQSFISWVNYSEQERRKMIEVISMFKDRETRDELGLSRIRDGFAELFFPGTTTLQTRAKYFLFIPWIYRYYEDRRERSEDIARKVRKREITLINALSSTGEDGVIGSRSGASLQRFPSSIYWIGLRSWGILRFTGTQGQYHRNLNRYYRQRIAGPKSESNDVITEVQHNWDPSLPEPPGDFPYKASFTLSQDEADYLKERLIFSCKESLLTHIVRQCAPVETENVRFPWLHPEYENFSHSLQERLEHARNFSETMQGAALLYNLMLAELRDHEEWISEYRDRIRDWKFELDQRISILSRWDLSQFWELSDDFGPAPFPTRRFINLWLENLIQQSSITDPSDNHVMRQIVWDRETRLKRGRSRLTSKRHLELWGGASGTGRLEYRWGTGNRIAQDIQNGLLGN